MSTRPITGEEAAAAAELSRLARDRPNDLIDPFPPATETEVLSDAGARGKEPVVHPRVAIEDGRTVGYGAVDLSVELRRCRLLGPVVHPAHRRRGHGRMLLLDLVSQARTAGQTAVWASIGVENGAGIALLCDTGFEAKASHTCFRLSRPAVFPALPEFAVEGAQVRRANVDHADQVHEFTRHYVPRNDKQTRCLLKSGDYLVIIAERHDRIVGFAEADLRYGDVATVEYLDGRDPLVEKGLGNALLAELIRAAFERTTVQHVDFLVPETEGERIERLTREGLQRRYVLVTYERSL
ncbi:MAG: GNAT family N-acetyltransferase [Planctomycetota bacterium]